jgi:spore coat protein U-like protein
VGALSTAQSASNQIGITCTNGVKYSVGLSLGTNGGTDPLNRLMANPATGQKIRYAIYQNATKTMGWGNSPGVDTQAGTGTGLTQNLAAYGQLPAQTTPSSGSYSDIVVVTVNY